MTKRKLLDQVRDACRLKHYSKRTEEAYVQWIRRFILFHNKRHPAEMGAPQIRSFLTHLAVRRNVAASTQNQAFNAILFLYREILQTDPGIIEGVERAKKPKRLPVVLTRDEVQRLLARLEGTPWLISSLLYGSGLRLLDALRLRVQDINFAQGELLIRDGKGGKDRHTMLPKSLVPICRASWNVSITYIATIWQRGLARSGCRTLWHANTGLPGVNGTGNMSSLRTIGPSIRAAG